MLVHNVRFGFATNSSSMHSIVLMSDKQRVRNMHGSNPDEQYGWNDFCLVNAGEKLNYLGNMFANTLRNRVPEHIATIIARELLNYPVEFYGVDHQSQIMLPFDYKEEFIDEVFLLELVKFLKRDDVIILGGNDNEYSSYNEDILKNNKVFLSEITDITSPFVCRFDPDYNYFTLFNRQTGAKLRISFDENVVADKSSTPELVDMKLTDYCPYGCGYCYQASTSQGAHADTSFVKELLWSLHSHEVFEVAFGGGDPTFHPHFDDLLDSAWRRHIVPNFSTRNLAFVRDMDSEMLNKVGGIALSTSGPNIDKELALILSHHGKMKSKFSIQIIDGVTNGIQHILEQCSANHIPVTVLGLKNTGRGKQIVGNSYLHNTLMNTIELLHEQHRFLRIGVDTTFASRYPEEMEKMKVNSLLYTTREGVFSCYIDAVRKKIGPSSFCPKREMVDVDYKQVFDNYPFGETK